MPLLTVIVPTYNRAALLVESLDSLRSQEFADFEVIVVDDGSTDDTAAVLARYAQGALAGKLRVLRQQNAGQGAARNLALAAAQGEYCSFLDSDDLFFPWTLAIVAEAIEANDRPSVLIGKELQFKTEEEFASERRDPLKTRAWPDLYVYMMQSPLGPCGVFVAPTRLLREAGGFVTDRIVGEDADLMFSLADAPKMVKIEAPRMFGYRVHTESFTRNYQRWYAGSCHFINRYRRRGFPGWPARAAEIRKITADAVAGFAFFTLFNGGRWQCLDLYLRTIGMQFRAGNYDYVFRTPFILALSALRLWPWRSFGPGETAEEKAAIVR